MPMRHRRVALLLATTLLLSCAPAVAWPAVQGFFCSIERFYSSLPYEYSPHVVDPATGKVSTSVTLNTAVQCSEGDFSSCQYCVDYWLEECCNTFVDCTDSLGDCWEITGGGMHQKTIDGFPCNEATLYPLTFQLSNLTPGYQYRLFFYPKPCAPPDSFYGGEHRIIIDVEG